MDAVQTTEEWAVSVIRAWEDKIERLQINDSRSLIESLEHHVITNSNGDATRIDFVFNLYGKFVDMGASRSHTWLNPREKKAWLRSEFFAKVRVLRAIIAAKYHNEVRQVLVIDGAGVGNLK